jgi:hypothetical protein
LEVSKFAAIFETGKNTKTKKNWIRSEFGKRSICGLFILTETSLYFSVSETQSCFIIRKKKKREKKSKKLLKFFFVPLEPQLFVTIQF